MKKLIICVLFSCVLAGCNEKAEEPQPSIKANSVISKTEYKAYPKGSVKYLLTIKHDNHLFIVTLGWHESSSIHHPDCPCLK